MHSKKAGEDIDWSSLRSVQDQQELIQLVVDDIVFCQRKAAASAHALGLDVGQVDQYVFEGHYPHQTGLERRMLFLQFLMEFLVSAHLCPHCTLFRMFSKLASV
jgi:hypothetical protein